MLIKIGRLTLNVSSTILWAGILDWIFKRGGGKMSSRINVPLLLTVDVAMTHP